jgi:rod shape-determining protein MreB
MSLHFGSGLAIDLGTANTCIFAPGKGIVVSEPSVIVFNAATGTVEAVGTEAREMLGRNPATLRPVRPIRDGVIADFDAAERMLTHFIRKAHRQTGAWARPRVVIGVPTEITPVERRAVKDSAHRAKASEVYLIDEPLAAAVGHFAAWRGHWPVRARGRRCHGRGDHSTSEETTRLAHRRTNS